THAPDWVGTGEAYATLTPRARSLTISLGAIVHIACLRGAFQPCPIASVFFFLRSFFARAQVLQWRNSLRARKLPKSQRKNPKKRKSRRPRIRASKRNIRSASVGKRSNTRRQRERS